MLSVHFGRQDEPAFELEESKDLLAIRTRSQLSVRGLGPVAAPQSSEVADGELVCSFPEAGVEVYRVPPAARSLDLRKRSLRTSSDVRFAGSVLVHAKSREPVVYTENLYVRFREDLDDDQCEALLREAGLVVKEQLGFATNAYFAAAPEGTGQQVFEVARQLLRRPDVVYCHPELIQRRQAKQIFPEQWHLKATSVGGVAVNAHANVEAAHALAKGLAMTIAVIDDGVDIDHPEFNSPGKVVAPRDATLGTDDPRPKSSGNRHGTACAGVACARGVAGASGVAPQARLMPIRLASNLGSLAEAQAFKWAADHGADVISCSWGPPDGDWFRPADPLHSQVFPLPASTRDAIDYAVTNGRGGKGCVVLFAAGNGNESVDNDGYASYANVIAVAACNDRSKRSVYSDFGKAVWCSFPSSDFGDSSAGRPEPLTPGIWTTDRVGTAGYNRGSVLNGDAAGNFTNSFGGTSSACPGAAGVAALVLSANPGLRWNEVRDILRRSCDRIDPAGGNYSAEGHSKLYGHGRLNALTAVKLAKETVGRLAVFNLLLNEPIPDLGQVEGSIDVTEAQPVGKVAVSVRLTHTYIGDLVITVIPPTGRALPNVVLHNRAGGSRDDIDLLYDVSNTPALSAYRGQVCQGTWKVRVEDKAAQDAGTLVQIGLQLSIPPVQPPSADNAPRATPGTRGTRGARGATPGTRAARSARRRATRRTRG